MQVLFDLFAKGGSSSGMERIEVSSWQEAAKKFVEFRARPNVGAVLAMNEGGVEYWLNQYDQLQPKPGAYKLTTPLPVRKDGENTTIPEHEVVHIRETEGANGEVTLWCSRQTYTAHVDDLRIRELSFGC